MKHCVFFACIIIHLYSWHHQCLGGSIDQHLLSLQKSKTYQDSIPHVLRLAKLYRESDAEKALSFGKKSISMSENARDTLRIALAYKNFFATLVVHGNYSLTYQYLIKTIEILKNRKSPFEKGLLYECLSTKSDFEYSPTIDFVKERNMLRKSLEAYRQINDFESQANVLYAFGGNYQIEANLYLTDVQYGPATSSNKLDENTKRQLLKKAEAYFQQAQTAYLKVPLDYRAAACKVAIAKVKLALGDTIVASSLLKEALDTYQNNQCIIGQGDVMFTLSTIYKNKGNFKKALTLAMQGLEHYKKADYNLELSMAMDFVSELYETKKDYKNVLKYRNLSWGYQKKSHNANTSFNLVDQQNSYENRLKNEQILQLKAQNKIADLEKQRAWYTAISALVLIVLVLSISVVFYKLKDKALKESLKNEALTTLLNQSLNQKAKEAELVALSAEMNPHFVFNVMASIQGLVLKNKQDEAVEYLNDFSRMSRNTLDFSRKKYISIKQEIMFLKNYLALETLRFEDKFEVVWNIPETLDEEIETPPMLIQPILENAIQHGLMRKKDKGRLEIALFINEEKQSLQFEISDNGVGRTVNQNTKHQSRATSIIQKRLELLAQEENGIGTIETIDLKNEHGQAIGTKVIIVFSYLKPHWA